MHKMSAKIYELLSVECEINIRKKVESLVGQTSDHKIFLTLVDEVWKDHTEQLNTIRNIFLYLDRYPLASLYSLFLTAVQELRSHQHRSKVNLGPRQ